MTPRDVRDHDAVLAAFRDNRPLLLVRPLPPAFHARDDLDPPYRRGLGFDLKVNVRVETIAAHQPASCLPTLRQGRCGWSTAIPRFAGADHPTRLVRCPEKQPWRDTVHPANEMAVMGHEPPTTIYPMPAVLKKPTIAGARLIQYG